MPLIVGDKLGPYEILAPLGAGGMGEVYRARDTKLDREVAIKVLPAALAHDAERLARFEREAKVLASLNHPNIAAIYGVEDSGGVRALVMELVPGAPLKTPLSLDTALNYARQIADALEAAHDKGIIHRDLKPANIMVTPEGVVKVLDFGLAAVAQPSSSSSTPENSPTMTMAATQMGVIMGTAAYMSPEQAAGKPVDKRADIWSFGVVLWEMLVGERLFEGETISHTLADVLRAPIDFDRLPAGTPRVIRELVKRCLDRDVKARLRDIGEARVGIQKYLANPEAEAGVGGTAVGATSDASAPLQSRLGRVWPWVVAALLAVALAGVSSIAYRATRPAEPKQLVRLDVDLGSDVSLGYEMGSSQSGADVIISPDGNRLVFVSKGRLFTRRLDHPEATELAGTEGAFQPFFSPDGLWVAFFTRGKLKKIPVEGGAAISLCDAPSGRGGSWGEDHNIIAALGSSTLSQVPDNGGPPTPVTELVRERTHRWPQILPGNKAVIFTAHDSFFGFDDGKIDVMSLKDHRRKTIVRGGTYGRYLPSNGAELKSGHIVYLHQGTLFAVRFDLDTLAVHGTPVPVLDQVSYSTIAGEAKLDFSSTGTVVYRSGYDKAGMSTLQWLDGTRKLRPILSKPGLYSAPHVSPDGKLLAYSVGSGGGSDIWTYDWERDVTSHLTSGGGNAFPVWTPDGRFVVFHADTGIFWARADGAGKPQPLTQKFGQYPWSFSPDGMHLAFAEFSQQDRLNIWTVPVETQGGQLQAGKPEVYLQTPADELYPAFSPDGHWIAYRSIEGGTSEIFVRAFPDKGGKWQISNSGGVVPVWSKNGRELFYRTPDERMMVVDYTVKGDSFVAGKPQLWFDKPLVEPQTSQNFDITPDGKRFAVLMPVVGKEEQEAENHVIFLLNFFDELRRKVPLPK